MIIRQWHCDDATSRMAMHDSDTVSSSKADLLCNLLRLPDLSAHLLRLPNSDRGSFSALSSVQDIQAWTTIKADQYYQFALTLRAIHNVVAPIHRLPTEVLERILEQCWENRGSLRLPRVCRLWRSILLGRAAFWADAVADCELVETRQIARNELPRVDALLSRATRYSHTIEPSFYTFTPSLAESLTPYISNVVSLAVALDNGDLQERLWPLLLSGMPNLESLEIQPMITKEGSEGYDEDIALDTLPNWYSAAWAYLPMLSRKTLPKLSRLTCPHNMVEYFGDIPLRHLRLEWWDRAQEMVQTPTVVFGEHGGLFLEPYRDTLETLEYMQAWGYATPGQSLELPSLRCLYMDFDTLHIDSESNVASRLLSWLRFPQTALIHIVGSTYLSGEVARLRLLVGAVDRVCLQRRAGWDVYRMQCFVGDTERLRMDDLWATRDDLVQLFGGAAPVTRLTLTASSPGLDSHSPSRGIDLRAFPHLVHLDASGVNMETMVRMLQPNTSVQREAAAGRAETAALPCPSLAELVVDIPCGIVERSTTASCSNALETYSSSELCGLADIAASDDADELFRQKCAILQRVLADRASSGSRLAALHLRLRHRRYRTGMNWIAALMNRRTAEL